MINNCVKLLKKEILNSRTKKQVTCWLVRRPAPKKLPNIGVVGDFWELAPIETLLIWEGYDLYKDENGWPENWNEPIINDDGRHAFLVPIKSIAAPGKYKAIQYMNHTNFNTFSDEYKVFYASEPEKILQYIHDFNK